MVLFSSMRVRVSWPVILTTPKIFLISSWTVDAPGRVGRSAMEDFIRHEYSDQERLDPISRLMRTIIFIGGFFCPRCGVRARDRARS